MINRNSNKEGATSNHTKKAGKERDEQKIIKASEQQISKEVKNAHASGLGALERGEEGQIEKLNAGNLEKDETVY